MLMAARADEDKIQRLVRKAVGSRAVLVRAFRRKCKPTPPSASNCHLSGNPGRAELGTPSNRHGSSSG